MDWAFPEKERPSFPSIHVFVQWREEKGQKFKGSSKIQTKRSLCPNLSSRSISVVVTEFQRSKTTLQQCLFPSCLRKSRETLCHRNEDINKNTIDVLSIRTNGAGSDP